MACFLYQPVIKTSKPPSEVGNVNSSAVNLSKRHPFCEISVLRTDCNNGYTLLSYHANKFIHLTNIRYALKSNGGIERLWRKWQIWKSRITDNYIISLLIYKGWSCLCRQRSIRAHFLAMLTKMLFIAHHFFVIIFVNMFTHVIEHYSNLNRWFIRTLKSLFSAILFKWKFKLELLLREGRDLYTLRDIWFYNLNFCSIVTFFKP